MKLVSSEINTKSKQSSIDTYFEAINKGDNLCLSADFKLVLAPAFTWKENKILIGNYIISWTEMQKIKISKLEGGREIFWLYIITQYFHIKI